MIRAPRVEHSNDLDTFSPQTKMLICWRKPTSKIALPDKTGELICERDGKKTGEELIGRDAVLYFRSKQNLGEHTMDTSKALDNDSTPSKMSWFQSSVLSTASFTIILISNNNPLHTLGLTSEKENYTQ